MKQVFIATSNKGKQREITKYAEQYGRDIVLYFPNETNEIKVDETGSTFEQNAFLKASAYRDSIADVSLLYVGDDSGIKIAALNDEPGVTTRRWAGYDMTDDEILAYCMERMKTLKGDDRRAVFQTVLSVVDSSNGEPRNFYGTLEGRILETPLDVSTQEGFPFRSIFWVDELDRPLYEIHDLSPEERGSFLTHREKAFKDLFSSISV